MHSSATLILRTRALAAEIGADHSDGVLAVGLLEGSLPFFADLVRALEVPVEVDVLAISASEPESGRVRLVKDLDTAIGGAASCSSRTSSTPA